MTRFFFSSCRLGAYGFLGPLIACPGLDSDPGSSSGRCGACCFLGPFIERRGFVSGLGFSLEVLGVKAPLIVEGSPPAKIRRQTFLGLSVSLGPNECRGFALDPGSSSGRLGGLQCPVAPLTIESSPLPWAPSLRSALCFVPRGGACTPGESEGREGTEGGEQTEAVSQRCCSRQQRGNCRAGNGWPGHGSIKGDSWFQNFGEGHVHKAGPAPLHLI